MSEGVRKSGQRRTQQRRGLHVLAWCLIFFVGAQIALGLVIDYLLPDFRFPWFYRLLDESVHVRNSETILCLGSSRFGTGLFAGEMTPMLRQATGKQEIVVINASLPGGDYITSEKMLNQLLERGIHPRLLLLEFCPELLNHHIGWLSMHTARTLCWHDLKDFGSELSTIQHAQRFLLCRMFPLVQYRNSIRARMQDRWLREDLGDLSPDQALCRLTDQHWIVELEQPAWPLPKQMSELANHFVDYQIGGQPVACLRRLLKRCEEEQIAVVLIEPPVSTLHREHYTLEIEEHFQRFAGELCSEYGLSRFSYRSAVPDEEFFDHHHCSRIGAQRWTERVTEEILVPYAMRQTKLR